MGHYSFQADLGNAQKKELELAQLLYRRGKASLVQTNNDNRYDLDVVLKKGGSYTIEVKNDMMYSRTGNLGVEFECRGKASGIDVTQADYWCFALDDGFWVMKTADLRDLITKNLFFRVAVGGDAGSQTKMYLFRGRVLKAYMRKLV